MLGRDFFPSVDAGQIRLHMRTATGTRIEETARVADEVEAVIRELVPKEELETILDNLGVPNSGINLSYSNAGTIGTLDGEISLSLKEGHRPTVEFVTLLRSELPKRFPGVEFFFQPADIVTQILNFGLPAAIDVQFTGNDMAGNAAIAAGLVKKMQQIPGAVDVHVHQRLDGPAVNLQMDRTKLQQMGLSAANVGQNVLVSLSGSSQTSPAFWLNPQNGIVYSIAVQAPQYRVDSMDSLLNVPVSGSGAASAPPQLLGNLVEATQARQAAVVSRYNILPAIDVYASVQGTDLAARRRTGAGPRRRGAADAAARRPGGGARPGADHEGVVHRPAGRPGDGDRPRLPAGGRQLPVLDRRLHHRRGAAGGAGRHRLDAVPHRHHALGAGAHRRDHDDGRGHRQQHPAHLVRQAAARRRRLAGRRPRAMPARPGSGRCS